MLTDQQIKSRAGVCVCAQRLACVSAGLFGRRTFSNDTTSHRSIEHTCKFVSFNVFVVLVFKLCFCCCCYFVCFQLFFVAASYVDCVCINYTQAIFIGRFTHSISVSLIVRLNHPQYHEMPQLPISNLCDLIQPSFVEFNWIIQIHTNNTVNMQFCSYYNLLNAVDATCAFSSLVDWFGD